MSTGSATLECLPNGEIPLKSAFGDLIPHGIPLIIVPGNDTEARYMTECCEPNEVNLVIDCYMWCKIPDRYIKDGESPAFNTDMQQCILDNGYPVNDTSNLQTRSAKDEE
ncbi:uncharacterized protein B0H64DRAFT_376610 [Chaetomium fimeti]|uniref:Uncharacterized protein n=1 Tax=Chaetomium fimeti TaxID=1854472 RepID=A0AAE0HCH3_9PEZI|nr:hypothetical protein B0H64DRAFT_376610 [Chaetomium fimeti]